MHVQTIAVGEIQTNCYIISCPETKACAIVDPGDESTTILDFIDTHGLKPEAIFLTHGHYDHTMAVDDIVQAFGVPVYIHEEETSEDAKSPYTYIPHGDTRFWEDGDTVEVGTLSFLVLHTPGHTAGSVCLKVGDCLFSGDTMFRDDCGRCDLPGGDYGTMLKSLAKIGKLEGVEDVFPGHMDATTLEREHRFNTYLKSAMTGATD